MFSFTWTERENKVTCQHVMVANPGWLPLLFLIVLHSPQVSSHHLK